MRSVVVACSMLLLGSVVAEAQPFYGYPPPPPGFGFRPPHPHWHCKTKWDWQGPKRICRWGW